MGKINKKYTKEAETEENEAKDDYKTASESEEDEAPPEKKRKADESSDDEQPLSANKKSKKSPKKSPAKSSGKKAKSKKQASKKADVNIPDEADENGEEEYEVKEIIDHKMEGGKSFYLVRWKGYTKDDDTWEPKESLSCKDLIAKFGKKKEEAATNGKSKKKGDKKSPKAKAKKQLPSDPTKEWEVDKIIDYAEEKGTTLYRIRWKGFSAKNDTWEPRDNLNCDDLIEKFERRMKTLENVSFKELREEPKKTKRLVNETAPRTNVTNKIGRSSKRSATKKRVFYGGDSDE